MNSPDSLKHIASVCYGWYLGRGVSPELSGKHVKSLLGKYGEPTRHYHGPQHIAELLELAKTHRSALKDPEAVELAILFHDAIYDTHKQDNEEQSAQYAARALMEMKLPQDLIDKVTDMIRRTANHDGENASADARYFLDMDLAILGSDRYAEYASQIKREFSWVPAPVYEAGRIKVLRHFLKREHIYFTDTFRKKLEATARANMEAELKALA